MSSAPSRESRVPTTTAATASLRGGETTIVVDDRGRLRSLRHEPTGVEYVHGEGTGWRIIATLGEWTEHPFYDHDNRGVLDASENRIRVRFDRLHGLEAELDASFTLTYMATERGIELTWTVENRSSETVREVAAPLLSGVRADAATIPFWCGCRFTKPHETLPDQWLKAWPDNLLAYPGTASMSWMHLESAGAGLYLAMHDPLLPATTFLVRRRPTYADCQLGFSRAPLIAPGKTVSAGTFILAAHHGDWRTGSRWYREFASTWMAPRRERSRWLAEAPAICALFMKHQNGRRFFDFPQLADIARDNAARGLNLPLFPFSWFQSGHDSGYPDYTPDRGMGGAEGLRTALAAVRDAGTNTMLYTQGRLIDIAGDYFRNGPGWEASYQAEGGNPHMDRYSWPIQSTIDPGKNFAVACPGSPAWREQLLKQVDQVLDLGAGGLLFDQIGGDHPYLCFAPGGHDHEHPQFAAAAKVRTLAAVRDRLDARGGSLMLELTCDAFIQFTDLCQSKGTNFNDPGYPFPTFAEMYRYTFPDHAITSRDAQLPDEIRYAWLIGLIPEYWRMQEPFEHVDRRFDNDPQQNAVAAYRAMMATGKAELETVIRARQKHLALTPYASFRHTDGISADHADVQVARYRAEADERHDAIDAVLAWNRGTRGRKVSFDWEGSGVIRAARLTADGLGRWTPVRGPIRLAAGERIVLARKK